MATTRHIYGEVDNRTGLHDVFLKIRKDVDGAKDRAELTELHRRAGYLVTLTESPAWKEKFGSDIGAIRSVARDEFARTARKINQRARAIGTDDDYDETWGN